MTEFLWIITADKNASFGKRGVSPSYIIPKGEMTVIPESLAGSRLWIILRGINDRLFQSLTIKTIEQITEGYYQGDYLASVDLLSSFRLVSKYDEADVYTVANTSQVAAGISEIDRQGSFFLSQLVKQRIEVKIAKPHVTSDIHPVILPRSNELLAKAALRVIVSSFNLNEIWASGTGKRLSAFSNFANSIITQRFSEKTATEVTDILLKFDPITTIGNEIKDQKFKEEKMNKPPRVDTDFTEVDPDKIYARRFLSGGDNFQNSEAALYKTEHAEMIHQSMVKDISEFLISSGITPYESSSIDLMFETNDKIKVCEIKSTTLDNFLSQSSKGAFQLTCYVDELVKSYDNVSPQLILRGTGNRQLEAFARKILSKMNIPVLFYDPNKSWPGRVAELLS